MYSTAEHGMHGLLWTRIPAAEKYNAAGVDKGRFGLVCETAAV
jgi:hypothetical protein